MQIVDRPPTQHTGSAAEAADFPRVFTFLTKVWELTSVRRVAWGDAPDRCDLWVIFREEDLNDAEQVHQLGRAYNRDAALLLDVHVVLPLVAEANLPPITTIWER